MIRYFILLILLALPMQSWAANYYFDFVNGDNGAAGTAAAPFKDTSKLNSLLSSGVAAGSNIYFKDGTTQYKYTSHYPIELSSSTGTAGGNPITFTSYKIVAGNPVSPGDSNNKPVITGAYLIGTWHSTSGWTGPDGNGVWYYASPPAGVLDYFCFEDNVPLAAASTSACSDGNYFGDTGANRLYYKATDHAAGGSPATHAVSMDYANPITVDNPANASNYITFSGLRFVAGRVPSTQAGSGPIHHWTIENCDFLGYGVSFMNHYYACTYITVQGCTFDYCWTPQTPSHGASISFENGTTVTTSVAPSFDYCNVLYNKVTHNATMYDGTPWIAAYGLGNDADCISFQLMAHTNIIGNDLSGYIGPGGGSASVNGGITVWAGAGQTYLSILGVADDGTGKVKITAEWGAGGTGYPWLTTGQRVGLYGIGQTTAGSELNTATTGIWTITVIDSSSFTLDGSSFPAGKVWDSNGGGRQEPDIPQVGNVIARNYIHDLTGYVDHGIQGTMNTGNNFVTDREIKIYANIIARLTNGYGQPTTGIQCSGHQSTTTSLCAHNTITGVDQGIFLSGGNWVIEDNILSSISTYYMYYSLGTYAVANTINYNCYDGGATASKYKLSLGSGAVNLAAWRAAAGWDPSPHTITGSPAFTNAGDAADFQIPVTSPCNGAGLAISGIALDYGGNAFASPPSMGAWEYASSSATTIRAATGIKCRQY